MWGLTPWGLLPAEGSWVWFMAERGWGTAGLGPLLYGPLVPAGRVCKCEPHQSGNGAEITAASVEESSHVWQMSTTAGSSVSAGPGRPP